jgi:glycosyltransferase involved in cell wall biosynthesis
MSQTVGEFPRPRLSVAAPCFNEEEGIAEVLEEWNRILDRLSYETEIVICNDGSTDSTGEILKDLEARYPRLRVVTLENNGGYGRALSTAVDATRGEYVATIDSDGQFDLADAERLLMVAEEGDCELVTGYRQEKKDTVTRVLANHALNLLVKSMFGVRLRDTNCAIKVARADALRGLAIEAAGWATPTEICLRVHARGQRIREVNVGHRDRMLGTSKVHTLSAAWGFFRYLVYMRLKLHLYRSGILSKP